MAGKKKDELKPVVPVNPISARAVEGSTGYSKPVKNKKVRSQQFRDFQYINAWNKVKTRFSGDYWQDLGSKNPFYQGLGIQSPLDAERDRLLNKFKPSQKAQELADQWANMSKEERLNYKYQDPDTANLSNFLNTNTSWATAAPSVKRKALIESAKFTNAGNPLGTEDIEFARALVLNPELALVTAKALGDRTISKKQLDVINRTADLLQTASIFVNANSDVTRYNMIQSMPKAKIEALDSVLRAVVKEYESRMETAQTEDQNPVISFLGATFGAVLDKLILLNEEAQHLYRATAVAVGEGEIPVLPNVMRYWDATELGAVDSENLARMKREYGDKNVQIIRDVFAAANSEDGFAKVLSKYANDEEALNIIDQVMIEDTRTEQVDKLIKDYTTISRDDLGNIIANTLLPDDWRMEGGASLKKFAWDLVDTGTNFSATWFGDPTLIAGKAVKGYKIFKYGLIKDNMVTNVDRLLELPNVKRFVDNVAPRIEQLNRATSNADAMSIRNGIQRDFGKYLNSDAVDSLSDFFVETSKTFDNASDAFGAWMRESDGVERLLMGRPVRAEQFLMPRMTRAKQRLIERRLRKNKGIKFDGSDDDLVRLILGTGISEDTIRAEFGLSQSDDIAKIAENPEFAARVRNLETRIAVEAFADVKVREAFDAVYGIAAKRSNRWSWSRKAWARRTDAFLRPFERAPMETKINIADASDADLFYSWARTTFSRTMSSYLRELWVDANAGQRRLMLSSMFETIADVKGIPLEERAKIVTSSMKQTENYGVDLARIDRTEDGTEVIRRYNPAEVNGRKHALHLSQTADFINLPNFSELQRLSTKVGVFGKIVGWTYNATPTNLTNWWSSLNLIGPRYVQRAAIEDIGGYLLSGGRFSEFAAGKLLTQSIREVRGKSTGVVGESARKVGDILQRKSKVKKPATPFASKEEEVKYIVEASNPNIKGNTEYVAMVKTDFIYSIREFDRLGADAIYENSAKRIADITKDLIDGKGFTDELIVSYDPASHSAILIEGNHRIQAAINAGIGYVPVRITKAFKGEIEEGKLIKLPGSAKVDYVGSSQNPFGVLPDNVIAKSVDDVTPNRATVLDSEIALTDDAAVQKQTGKLFMMNHLDSTEIREALVAFENGNTKKLTELISLAVTRNKFGKAAVQFTQLFKRNKISSKDIEDAARVFVSLGDNAFAMLDETAELTGDLNNFILNDARYSIRGGRMRRDMKGDSYQISDDWDSALTFEKDPEAFYLYWYKNIHTILHTDGAIGQHVFRALLDSRNINEARKIAVPKIIEELSSETFPAYRLTMLQEVGVDEFARRYFDDSSFYLLNSDNVTPNNQLLDALARVGDDDQILGKLYLMKNTEDIADEVDINFIKQMFDNNPDARPTHVLGKLRRKTYGDENSGIFDKTWSVQADALGRGSREVIANARFITEFKALKKALLKPYIDKGLSPKTAEKLIGKMALERAQYLAVSYMDNPRVRSIGAYSARNIARYFRATEDFARRIVRLGKYNPEAIQKVNVLYSSMENTGFTWVDDNGNSYFMYPGTGALHKAVATVFNLLPFPFDMYTTSPYAFGGNLSMLTPSADPDAWLPTFSSPISGFLIKGFTSMGPFEELEGWLLGPKGTKQPGTPAEWGMEMLDSILPSHLKRALNILPLDYRNSQYAAAVRGSIQILAYNGELDGGKIKTKADEIELMDKISQTAMGVLVTRFVLGFMVPASPQLVLDEGISDELRALGVKSLRKGFTQLLEKYEGDSEKALAVWYKLNPKLMPFTVSSTESVVGGTPPYTLKALDWFESNKDFAKKHVQASAFLAPAGGEFSYKAYSLMRSLGYIQNKEIDDFFTQVITANDYYMYLLTKDDYEAQREQAVTSFERGQLDERWKNIKAEMFARNPYLEVRVAPDNLGKVGFERKRILSEMRVAVDEIYKSYPDMANPNAKKIYQMIKTFDDGMAELDQYKQGNSSYYIYNRDRIRTALAGILEKIAGDNVGATNFYNRVLKPLIEG